MTERIVVEYANDPMTKKAHNIHFKMADDYIVEVSDAVFATVPEHARVKLSQILNRWSVCTKAGGLFGLIGGLMLLHPVLGPAARTKTGTLFGRLQILPSMTITWAELLACSRTVMRPCSSCAGLTFWQM